ncbi:MAG TPA: FAD-dependent monooxygenase [Candidatus Acidoferrum sp.]|nr:FAD-dependent monooxygenase [Candidatus Acidoferrum sp.]
MSSRADVFVVGGGPAGLAAAIAARKKGLSVVVADGAQFPIEKACGEGLMPATLAALTRLGVQVSKEHGYAFHGIKFLDESLAAKGEFPQGAGLGIRRTVLHEHLVRAAERVGVRMLWNTPVSAIQHDCVQAGGQSFQYRWLIGADGVQSRVAKWFGLDRLSTSHRRFARQQHFRIAPWSPFVEIYWAADSQAYVTPVASDEVCVVFMSRDRHARIPALLEIHPELNKRLLGAATSSVERGAIAGTRVLRRVAHGNVLLVGDASGIVDAITGEGLRLGFEQAFAAIEAIAQHDVNSYNRTHPAISRRSMNMARLLLSIDGRPMLRRRVMGALSDKPELFQSLLSIHTAGSRWSDRLAAGAGLGLKLLFA